MATLPGIQKASLAMPDIHWGYGFCIGGVAATDPEEGGVISPGGVGYDINCGVRLLRTNLDWSDVKEQIRPLVDQLFRDIPTGVGQSGRLPVRQAEADPADGARSGLRGRTRATGPIATSPSPRPAAGSTGPTPIASAIAPIMRGYDQCGTLGSGNHFLEVQVVDRVLDASRRRGDGPARGPDHGA